jgi:hypothetical protein
VHRSQDSMSPKILSTNCDTIFYNSLLEFESNGKKKKLESHVVQSLAAQSESKGNRSDSLLNNLFVSSLIWSVS